jgi:hypothetical protein
MGKRTYIRLAVAISLFVLTSMGAAEQEQWLQYRSAREASQIVGGMHMKALKLRTEKPRRVKLPKFKGQNQLFVRWLTPMIEKGPLWMALDRTHENGLYDLLYVDSNGNGRLNDETAIKAYRMESEHAYFGPIKIVFASEDGPITYHLNLRLCDHGNRALYVSSGGWYEGNIVVGGKTLRCLLIDYSVNGTFNDTSATFSKIDRVRLGSAGNLKTHFAGKYIEIDDKLYRPEIARDGAYIKLTEAEDVQYGSIQLPESITEVTAGGENGLFTFKPEKGAGSLPVGKYRINSWAIERKDEKGAQWKLQGSSFSEKSAFDITPDKEMELSIGEPIVATIEAKNKSGTYSFNHSLRGQLRERIELTRNGTRPQAPKLHVKSKDGTYDRTFDFRYG